MDFGKLGGLVPAVIQDDETGEVLMVGFMNEEALAITRRNGQVTFFSRSRQRLWTKGETSGNRLAVRRILTDCDRDAILVRVERLGSGKVCHTGRISCFAEELPFADAPGVAETPDALAEPPVALVEVLPFAGASGAAENSVAIAEAPIAMAEAAR